MVQLVVVVIVVIHLIVRKYSKTLNKDNGITEQQEDQQQQQHDVKPHSTLANTVSPIEHKIGEDNIEPLPQESQEKKEAIEIRVTRGNNDDVTYKIKKGRTLDKLIENYCKRVSLDPNTARFVFEGKRMFGDKTSEDMGMHDNEINIVECFMTQIGGCSYNNNNN